MEPSDLTIWNYIALTGVAISSTSSVIGYWILRVRVKALQEAHDRRLFFQQR